MLILGLPHVWAGGISTQAVKNDVWREENPQHLVLRRPLLGWGGHRDEWRQWFHSSLTSILWFCCRVIPRLGLIPRFSPLATHGHTESHTLSRALKGRHRVRHLSQASLGSQRVSWPNNFRPILEGLVSIGREWLFSDRRLYLVFLLEVERIMFWLPSKDQKPSWLTFIPSAVYNTLLQWIPTITSIFQLQKWLHYKVNWPTQNHLTGKWPCNKLWYVWLLMALLLPLHTHIAVCSTSIYQALMMPGPRPSSTIY